MEPDWTKCIICQQQTSEPLKCSLQGPGTNEAKTKVYEDIFWKMLGLLVHFLLPSTLKVLRLLLPFLHIVHLGINLAI